MTHSNRPGELGTPKIRVTAGRPRLASTRTTLPSWRAAAAVARWAATVLTPSPPRQLVTPSVRSGMLALVTGPAKLLEHELAMIVQAARQSPGRVAACS